MHFFAVIRTTLTLETKLQTLQRDIKRGESLIHKIKEKHRINVLVRKPVNPLLNVEEDKNATSNWGLPDPTNAKYLLGIKDEEDDFIGHFMEYIFKQGIERFRNSIMYLKIYVERAGKDFLPDIKNATDHYVKQLRLYYNYLMELDKTRFSEEMILIDMVDSSTKLFYNTQRKLLHAFTKKTNATLTKELIQFVTDSLYEDMMESKKRGFQYICGFHDICKVYPGFSDFLADMITEILKLPDSKLVKVRDIVANTLSKRKDAIAAITTDDSYLKLVDLGKTLTANNIHLTRSLLKKIRATIAARHKLVDTKIDMKLRKARAKRMFLDMIDKVFEEDGEDEVSITFITTERELRQWMLGVRKEIDEVVRHFVNYVIEMCRYDWDLKTQKEIISLTEFILNGGSKHERLLENLLSDGSSYLRSRAGALFNLPIGLL